MNRQIKGTRIFLLIFGGIILFFSVFGLLADLLIREAATITTIEQTWLISMSFQALIGLVFMFFGIFINKIKKGKFLLHLAISALSIILIVLSDIFVVPDNASSTSNLSDPNHHIDTIFNYFGMAIFFLMFIIPEIIIGIRLYRIERNIDVPKI